MSSSASIFSWFWSERIWVHPGYTWPQVIEAAGVDISDLYWSIATALVLLVVRRILESFIFKPLGLWYGLKPDRTSSHTPAAISTHPALEEAWKTQQEQLLSFEKSVINGLLKKTDGTLSERQIERWIRRKANCYRSSRIVRFSESAWRMTFYTFAFCFGLYTLSDKDWLWDSTACFANYPEHRVGNKEWFYYNIELGFYISLLISQFTDVPKKDFYQMLVHHLVTILLLTFSWTCNFVRIGTLVLVIHDFADIPLEGAKICRYIRARDSISNAVFIVFTLCWLFSRLGLLPIRVISFTSWYALDHLKFFPAYYVFNLLLIALQVLHVIWTVLILRIAKNALSDGVKDLREDSSLGESSDDQSVGDTSSSMAPTSNGIKCTGDSISFSKVNNGSI